MEIERLIEELKIKISDLQTELQPFRAEYTRVVNQMTTLNHKNSTKLDNVQTLRNALKKLDMETLQDRREQLCLNFAVKCSKHPKSKEMLVQDIIKNTKYKMHTMRD